MSTVCLNFVTSTVSSYFWSQPSVAIQINHLAAVEYTMSKAQSRLSLFWLDVKRVKNESFFFLSLSVDSWNAIVSSVIMISHWACNILDLFQSVYISCCVLFLVVFLLLKPLTSYWTDISGWELYWPMYPDFIDVFVFKRMNSFKKYDLDYSFFFSVFTFFFCSLFWNVLC